MASLTFSTPNGLNYGTGDVTVELTGGPSFTVNNIVISGSSSWTFDIDDPLYGVYGVNPDIHHFNGTYTFNFDNGCTSVHQIDVPQFTEDPCPDNCKRYSVINNDENTPFYYSDCETGEVKEISVKTDGREELCICDGEYYDPSGRLNIAEIGVCSSDFNCDITTAVLTASAIEGQDVLSNIAVTNEGNSISPISATPSQFQAGVSAYDITYVIPFGYGNSGETCTITIDNVNVCVCVNVKVTYEGEQQFVRYEYTNCENKTEFGRISPGEEQYVCMCELETPRVPKLIYEGIGLCDPNGDSGDGHDNEL